MSHRVENGPAGTDGGESVAEIEIRLALCRSQLWQALATGFARPSEGVLASFSGAGEAAGLSTAAALLDAHPGGSGEDEAGPGLHDVVTALVAHLESRTIGDLEEGHRRLFGHTSRGEVPPYETEYGEGSLFQKPQEISDILGFLRAFGLTLDPLSRERPDHVSIELEFLAFLSLKEAHALETRDEEMFAGTRRAERLFLKDHLGRFGPALAARLERADPDGFYGLLGRIFVTLLRRECRRVHAPCGPVMLPLREEADDGAPMACGSDSDSHAAGGSPLLSIRDAAAHD